MFIRHIGIVSNDIERSIDFYQLLEFEIEIDKIESGKYIDNFFNKENLSVRIIKMRNNHGEIIELLQFVDTLGRTIKKDLMTIGLTHIAISVYNIEEIKEILKLQSSEIVSDIQTTPDNCKVMFVRDPNGVFIELVKDTDEHQ